MTDDKFKILSRPEHEVAYRDLCALVEKHAKDLMAIELLAVAANMVGKLIALQDQRLFTPEQVLKIVAENIATGNQAIVHKLLGPSEGNA